jgi:hypothetical protein
MSEAKKETFTPLDQPLVYRRSLQFRLRCSGR